MTRADTMQRLSIAIEALKHCRAQLIHTCSGDPHIAGLASAEATMAAIKAESQVEMVLRTMAEGQEEAA